MTWRKALLSWVAEDDDNKRALKQACAEDPLFWINAFGWTFNPRKPRGMRYRPMVTWPFQDEFIMAVIRASGTYSQEEVEDILVHKSREVGASWCFIFADMWMWSYTRGATFLWGSRKQEYVYRRGDAKTLFAKAAFILEYLPGFLVPDFEMTELRLENYDTGSQITGESANVDFARGGRFTGIRLDEFAACEFGEQVLAATADAGSRLFVSTPKGRATAHFKQERHMAKTGAGRIFHLRWWQHPEKRVGLYRCVDGKIEILDKEYCFPPNYQFVYDGKHPYRSVWCDAEDRRRGSRLEMAQEVWADDHEAGSPFYESDVLDSMEDSDVREPNHAGELLFTRTIDKDTDMEAVVLKGFTEDRGEIDDAARKDMWADSLNPGDPPRLHLWIELAADNRPSQDTNYGFGIDVSGGGSRTQSVIWVNDRTTGEQVAELATVRYFSYQLAEYCRAMQLWFGGKDGEPVSTWEVQGPGGDFGERLMRLGASNIYYRDDNNTKPGWGSSQQGNLELHTEHRRALNHRILIIHSAPTIEQCRQIRTTLTGVEHVASRTEEDPKDSHKNHGDHCRASALCWLGGGQPPVLEIEEPEVPPHSLAARNQWHEEHAQPPTQLATW